MYYKETRPWGNFENILEEENCKVKKITVNPDKSLSYQYHKNRSEVWTIVQGKASFTLDDFDKILEKGSVVEIPKLSKHKIKNIGQEDLIFIEVQLGEYFGEDDIVRLQDDYGRI
jgi:mannose-6-phosphate isomerase-like protein (cupin superfamily)